MLSVPVFKCAAVLLVIGLFIGCLGLGSEKAEVDDSERLVDSARAKVDAADQYIVDGDASRAVDVLEDARSDLDETLGRFNSLFDGAEMQGILAAAQDIDDALLRLKQGRPMVARTHVAASKQELVRVSISLLGAKDRIAPERFSVTEGEIPLTYYDAVDGVYIGYQAVPHNIAKAAREAFYAYSKSEDVEELNRGVFLAELLIAMASEREGGFVVWENNFPWPAYDLSSGWIGALSQAGCLKALMLAHMATGDERYREFGDKALKAFEIDISDGGLRTTRTDGTGTYVWYPEYASSEPPYVLNGFITAVTWIGEYSEFMADKKAASMLEDGIITISHFLPEYDVNGSWSYYDALGHRSNEHYHRLHVKQVALLYEQTRTDVFKEYQEKWRTTED